ncbi:MAG: hypothetical protein WCK09_10860 [Bacteroidota bacterium]
MQDKKQKIISTSKRKSIDGGYRHYLIFVLLMISMPVISEAQTDSASTRYFKLPARVSFGSQIVGFPYQNLFNAFNPYLSVGTEFRLNKSEKHRICQTLNLGMSFSDEIGTKIFLNSDFCYRYTHSTGIFGDISVGLGLLNQYHVRKTYKFNSSTGEYDKVSDHGIFGVFFGYGMSLGYDFSRKTRYPVSLFVKNTFYIQSPYFDNKDFSIMPQSTIQIGFTIKFKKHEK